MDLATPSRSRACPWTETRPVGRRVRTCGATKNPPINARPPTTNPTIGTILSSRLRDWPFVLASSTAFWMVSAVQVMSTSRTCVPSSRNRCWSWAPLTIEPVGGVDVHRHHVGVGAGHAFGYLDGLVLHRRDEPVGLEPLDRLGVFVDHVDRTTDQAVPVGIVLLLDVEGELVDQTLVKDRLRGQVGVLHPERGDAVGGEDVDVRGDEIGVVAVDADPISSGVDHQAARLHEEHVVVAGVLGVGLRLLDGVHRLRNELIGGGVDLRRLTLVERPGGHVERGLLDGSWGPGDGEDGQRQQQTTQREQDISQVSTHGTSLQQSNGRRTLAHS